MRQQYEPSADRIIALYQQLEDDILSAVIRRILKMGYVSEASKHQLEVLQAAGLLYDDIVQLIADRTDACTAQVRALFEDAGVQTVEIDNSLHEAAGALPIDIRQDSSTRQVLEAGYKKTLGTMQNLVSTTATQTQTAFIQTCDRIYMQVSSGAFSYQEAIMNALRALADTGATVSYPTGHTDRMDVAVRRCVLTGVSQTAAAVSLRQAEDAGCYLMEITAHSGARPDHAKWQGQLVTITGKDAGKIIDGLRVFTLSEIGYGSGEGFKGWNCRHNWHAYYPGFSTPNYTPEELKRLDEPCISYNGKLYTEYEVSQMQRAQERRVRAWKRRCITAQEGVNSATDEATRATAQAEFDRSARYLKTNEAKLKDFCRQTGQDRDRFREQVLGFNKSTAQKAMHAAKRNHSPDSDSDFIEKINNLTGREYLNAVRQFQQSLPNIPNRQVSAILKRACRSVKFRKTDKKACYFSGSKNTIYLRDNAENSTIAHELFHKVDHDYGITGSNQLDACINFDYQNLKNRAKKAGLPIEDMLYLEYPEAFIRRGKVKEAYRGFSDIINGMTSGRIRLGYYHKNDYWKVKSHLPKETFAQYGRFYYDNNPEVLKLVTETLPETSKQMEMLIRIIDSGG